MTPALKFYRQICRRLAGLFKDLAQNCPDPGEVSDWDKLVEARNSLPEGESVRLHYLACRFLEEYGAWRQLDDRVRQFFGESMERFEVGDSYEMESFVDLLLGVESFRQRFVSYIDDIIRRFQRLNERGTDDVDELLQQFMLLDRAFRSRTASDYIPMLGRIWTDEVYAPAAARLRDGIVEMPRSLRSSVGFHLAGYRRNMLMTRRLESDGFAGAPTYLDVEIAMDSNERVMRKMNNPFLNDDLGSMHWEQNILPLIADLEDYFENWGGFSEAYDVLTGPDMVTGEGQFCRPVNVIPAEGASDVCHSVCLVFARVAGKRNSANLFGKLMKTLWAHLTRCQNTKSIVVVTDWWDAKIFEEEYLENLRAFHDVGRRFVFLAVGCPDTKLSPIPVDLS